MIDNIPEGDRAEGGKELPMRLRRRVDVVYDLWPNATKISSSEPAYQQCLTQNRTLADMEALFSLVPNWDEIRQSKNSLLIYTAYAQYTEALLNNQGY